MISIEPPSWAPTAAYYYTLHLDEVSLAWEYLRRNARYCADFSRAISNLEGSGRPHRWGLEHWEDPRIDARITDPHWSSSRSEILLEKDRESESTFEFSIWKIPGRKTVWHCGDQLRLTSRRVNEVLHRVRWKEDLCDGDPCRVSVVPGRGFTVRARIVQMFLRSLDLDPHDPFPDDNERPSLHALTHMQVLQALDAEAAGASQREIAERLFGFLRDFDWDADSRWRARVRYLLKCGQARTSGGYRRMVAAASPLEPEEGQPV